MAAGNSSAKYIAFLAALSAGILVLGVVLKPRKEQSPPVSETEMARLRRLSQRQSLNDMTAYFSGVAEEAATHLVRVRQMDASGVVLDTGNIVATAGRPDLVEHPPDILTPGGREIRTESVVASPEIPVTALRVPGGSTLQPASLSVESSVGLGEWVVGVARDSDGKYRFTPGAYGGTAPSVCGEFHYQEVQTSIPLGMTLLGGGVFDLDGGLLAVVARCGERYTAVSAIDMQSALQRAGSLSEQLLARYGMRVTDLASPLSEYFKAKNGALVTETWDGGLADEAGLGPGDIIQELDGTTVLSPEDLQKLLLPVAVPAYELRVRRNRRNVRVSLSAADLVSGGNQGFHDLGLVLQPPAAGFLVEEVRAGSPAQLAGLRTGDRVLQVDRKPLLTRRDMNRLLASSESAPRYFVVQRNIRKLGILVR